MKGLRTRVLCLILLTGAPALADPPAADEDLSAKLTPVDAPTTQPEAAPRLVSRQVEDRIEVAPIGLQFRLPPTFMTWQKQFHNNIHVGPEALAAIRDGGGEWDTEYAAVVNAALPFDRCVAAAGEEGWGRDGVSFTDVQLRVYVLDQPIKELIERIDKQAPPAIAGLAHAAVGRKAPAVVHSQEGEWSRAAFTFTLWYGDYGGEAMVDFRLRRLGPRTVAAVFMYPPAGGRRVAPADIVKAVMASFALTEAVSTSQPDTAGLIDDLGSDDGDRRIAATRALLAMDKDALEPLRKAGAKQVSPVGTISTRRMDMVYSLLEGLRPNPHGARAGYASDGFGLRVDAGCTREEVVRMGVKYGFAIQGQFTPNACPTCYAKLQPGRKLADVLRAVLSDEPKVISVNLNYFEA
ncbi:MAG: hypothetical protein BIFFINMI_02351 [Phycisphaerae bacterium]|nr:hypothetical protein [Phycisphaerae bacterium]